jgi:hypothetical protein
MTEQRKGLSSDELQAARDEADLQAARDEAKRRIAACDKRAARRAAHEKRIGPFRDAIGVAIREQAAAFPSSADGKRHPREQRVSAALLTLLRACRPPREADDKHAAHAPGCAPAPAAGPPKVSDLETVLSDLEMVRRHADRALVEQLRALCDAARATGIVNESALAESDPRITEALETLFADRAEREAWRTAPSRQAGPGEPLDVVTARVLVERGRTPFEATRMVLGKCSDEVRDSPLRKMIERAVKAQAKRAAPPAELSPADRAELERVIEESPRRSR